MIFKGIKVTAGILTAAVVFSGAGMTASASGSGAMLPSAGVDLTIANGNRLEDILTSSSIPVESIIEWINTEDSQGRFTEGAVSKEAAEEELFRNLVIAQVNAYVNVRSIPSEEGEILGKLYNNSVGTFLEEENGWYKITSGTVTGYGLLLCEGRILCHRRGCSGDCKGGGNPDCHSDDPDSVCQNGAYHGVRYIGNAS